MYADESSPAVSVNDNFILSHLFFCKSSVSFRYSFMVFLTELFKLPYHLFYNSFCFDCGLTHSIV